MYLNMDNFFEIEHINSSMSNDSKNVFILCFIRFQI